MDTVIPQWDLPGINLPTTTTTIDNPEMVIIGPILDNLSAYGAVHLDTATFV